MNFISLFAGIGGLDLGLERAGMTCVAQVEIDEFCQKVLAKNLPNVPKFKDVRDVGKHNLPAADLICGGFPCQPHSYAGKRRGKEDDRNLWGEYLRVIREVEPRFVVGENVPGLITTMLDEILSDLENIGYTSEAFVIPACAFDAPHRRNRVFIIAKNTKRDGCELRENDEPVSLGFKWDIGAGDEVGIHLQPSTALAGSQRRGQGRDYWEERRIQDNQHRDAATQEQERQGRERRTGAAYPVVANTFSQQRKKARLQVRELESRRQWRNPERGNWNGDWLEIATRLCGVDDGLPVRLDGFELSATDHREHRLKALGNAVVPQVAEWIGRRIMEAA
jgi:DNA-cytosine methyltransferase